MEQILSPKEFIIAGLLNEGPSYGYEIEQKIKNRGMRNWTQIGFSSIYHILGKLRKAGHLSQTANIVNGKLQQVYRLTEEGKQALAEQIRLSITTVKQRYDDFDVAIANTVEMPSEDIRDLLRQRMKELAEAIFSLEKLLSEKLETGTPDIPTVTILFDRPIAILKAERKFLQLYIEKF